MEQSLLEKLHQHFEEQNKYQDYEGLKVSFSANLPASQTELQSLQESLNFKVPADYLDFLKHFNGCVLFSFQDIGGFRFLGTQEIFQENKFMSEVYEEDWDEKITVFCQLIGEGDFISFKQNENQGYQILDCFHEEIPQNWQEITDSFEQFLEKLLELRGERYWLKNKQE